MSAMCHSLLLGELLVRSLDVVQATQAVEGLLWVVIELAVADALESVDGLGQRDVGAWQAGELLCDEEVLAQEALNTTCTLNGDLVLLRQLFHTKDGDDVLEFLVLLQDVNNTLCNFVVVLAHDGRLQNTRGRSQRVHSRVNTLGSNTTVQLGGCIEVGEGGGRSRVGVVIRRNVNGLQRGNRLALRGGNALLQDTHLVSQGWLVANGGRHTAQQGRNLRTCLGETEDVVDEQQHVLVLHIAEVLRHGQAGQSHAHTDSWRLIHLAEHEGGVLENAHLFHFEEEVGALTGTLADAGEDGSTGELACDTSNHLLDKNGLTNTCTAEEADLAALHVRGQEVDNLNTGLQDFGLALELVECWRLAVDAPLLAVAAQTRLVEAVAQCVEDVALDHIADWNGDWLASIGHGSAADEAVGRCHGNGTDEVVTEVLSDLEGDGLCNSLESNLDGQCVVQCRQSATRELHVDDRTDDAHHTAGNSRRLCVLLLQS